MLFWIVLIIAAIVGWRWNRWRGVAIAVAVGVGIVFLSLFFLIFLGSQVSAL